MNSMTTSLIAASFVVGCLVPADATAADQKGEEPKAPKNAVDVRAHSLEGTWEQRFAYGGKWPGMLLSEVTLRDGKLQMNVLDQNQDPSFITSRGISNVRHVLDIWTFDSDRGSYGVGNFVLTQQAKDNYAGQRF